MTQEESRPAVEAAARPLVQEDAGLTRVEVIDETGRAYVRWGVPVRTELQDEGRTLKVFVRADDPRDEGDDVERLWLRLISDVQHVHVSNMSDDDKPFLTPGHRQEHDEMIAEDKRLIEAAIERHRGVAVPQAGDYCQEHEVARKWCDAKHRVFPVWQEAAQAGGGLRAALEATLNEGWAGNERGTWVLDADTYARLRALVATPQGEKE